MAAQVTNYQCPACTGPLHFEAGKGRLECEYCGSAYSVEEIESLYAAKDAKAAEAQTEAEAKKEAAREAARDSETGESWDLSELGSDWGAEGASMRAYTCPSCSAQIICEETTAATSCPYCGNPTVVPGRFDGTLKPDYVIPFQMRKEQAIAALKKHYEGRPFLPKEFKNANHLEEIKGVYVPFWLFDGEAEGEMAFEATRSYTQRQGDYRVTSTEHYHVYRAGKVAFQKIPVDGSKKMPDDYMDSLEPFDYKALTDFSPAYLPGFLADKYDMTAQECAPRADARAAQTAADCLKDTVRGYESVMEKHKNIRLRRGKVKYALLPVWLLTTRWNGANYLFAMNGQTGKFVGNLPEDKKKKRGLFAAIYFLLALLLAFFMLVLPAKAAEEYGAVYDETGILWSEELEELGTEVLPEFSSTYQIDLRVDVLTGIGQEESIENAARYLYEEYGYGSENGGNGVTLTILVHEDETGVALDEWYPYAAGDSWELTTNATWNLNVGDLLTEEAWAGDLSEDKEVLADAVTNMAQGMEDFVLAGGVGGTIWSPHLGFVDEEDTDTTYEEDSFEQEEDASETRLNYVTDVSGILTDEEWEQLELRAMELSEQYDFGIYIITVDDYTEYTYGDVFDAAVDIYHGYSLGRGSGRDGVLLFLSMYDRDYSLITYGDFGNYTFNDSGREAMTRYFLDDFGEDEWYDGFADYLEWSGRYLEAAKNGEPYSESNPPMTNSAKLGLLIARVAATLLVPLAVAAIVVGTLSAKMRTVAKATRAASYLKGNVQLSEKYDRYTHTTEIRQKINNESSGGGGTSRSSGGASGTSGKF